MEQVKQTIRIFIELPPLARQECATVRSCAQNLVFDLTCNVIDGPTYE